MNPRGILSRHQFVKQIRAEKRRTDRFKGPLSVMLFQVHPDQRSRPGQFGALVDLLRDTKRETDLIGYLGDGLVGVLLIHTDGAGLQCFASKVAAAAQDLTYTSTSGTYPDQVFERLIAADAVEPDTLPYFIDYDTEHGAIQLFLKRSMDIVGALVLLLLAAPIMLAASVAIKVTSPGPVIYTQLRLGRKGVPFAFYKFRSMTVGADETVHREYVTSLIKGKHDEINQGEADRPIYKLQGDSRVTRVGFFIRKTSIDELPQLFNVLKGDLSLVGPTAADPIRGRAVPVLAPAPHPGRPARHHGALAGRGAQSGLVRRDGPDGPALHPYLDALAGPQDPGQDRWGRAAFRRREVSDSA